MSFPGLVKSWIWISTLASLAGWLLSAAGQLNRLGYTIFGLVLLAGWFVYRQRAAVRPTLPRKKVVNWPKFRRRFGRPFPLGFAVLTLLVLVGGLLYPPTNHSGLTYRTSRVLNWLSQEHWFWIHSPNYRMNNRACGFEWLSAPLLLFTKSDRSLFLINFLPFLLLPGLIFSVFTRWGVKPRVAWPWMWLLPTGYTFLLQAGSIANDTFPTVYALAAVDFACRAWISRRPNDLWYSILSAALLTGAKASNIPLLLPWTLLLIPVAPMLIRKPVWTVFLCLLALVVSFVPTALLNALYCGDWSGLKLERAGMAMREPWVGIWGNGLILLVNNFVPPVFLQAGSWNQNVLNSLPQAMVRPLVNNFENGFHQLLELQTEEWAGIGFGLSVLLAVSFAALPFYRSPSGLQLGVARKSVLSRPLRLAVLCSPWVALLVYCIKSGMVTPARLISPYYPLLLPLLLTIGSHEQLIRRRWWRALALSLMAVALPVVVFTPARPLFPARTIFSRLQQLNLAPGLVSRAGKVYSVYSERSDPLKQVRRLLPTDLQVVGFMADGDDMDISFWRPFGQRRVEHILLDDPPHRMRQRHIEYVVIGEAHLAAHRIQIADWLERNGGHLVASMTATIKVTEGPQPWYIVRLSPEPALARSKFR